MLRVRGSAPVSRAIAALASAVFVLLALGSGPPGGRGGSQVAGALGVGAEAPLLRAERDGLAKGIGRPDPRRATLASPKPWLPTPAELDPPSAFVGALGTASTACDGAGAAPLFSDVPAALAGRRGACQPTGPPVA
ncbi:hypothetical protein [Arenibaculum pallidiluteum]|uniref:hypothetical protein n=1 Tax=Arenibaculum pallidiluteum TaxID=2812559 RepID=UPI001A97BA93|nr:hypothetical protein [Arenibaculum pallidiluteum]